MFKSLTKAPPVPSSAEPKFSYYLSVNWRPKHRANCPAIDDDF